MYLPGQSIKAKINSLLKKCFEKHIFCICARLAVPLIITILASDGPLVSVTRIFVHKNGTRSHEAGALRCQLVWMCQCCHELGFQAWTPWQGPDYPAFTLAGPPHGCV